MTDKQWKKKVKQISNPYVLLKEIVDSQNFFGDPYYSDLVSTLIEQAEKLAKENKK